MRAEREQGITIDVAHRYFATPRRSFILADSPGHAQYTRNMVTAASTADVAIVLVDVRHGVTEQTRRHAYIAALVGVEQLVLAVNKMDLVDWDPDRFDAVVAELRSYLDALPTPAPPLHVLPVSALHGDNVVAPSERAPWYDGPPLLSLLEEADTRRAADVGARLDVQWCIRHPPADFRAIAGRLSGAPLRVGDDVTIAPSGTRTRVGAIARGGRSAEFAGPGQAITVTFTDHVDVARGDVVLGPLGAGTMPVAVTELDADLCWMTEAPLVPGARMGFKHGTRTGTATVTRIEHRVDVTTLVREAADELRLNDLGRVRLSLASSIVALPYRQHQEAGRLVLIDPADHSTAAAAMIHGFVDPSALERRVHLRSAS